MNAERADAVRQEAARSTARERALHEAHEAALSATRARLHEQWEAERARLEAAHREEKARYHNVLEEERGERSVAAVAAQRQQEATAREQRQTGAAELAVAQAAHASDLERLRNGFSEEHRQALLSKEASIRTELTRQRDEELEMVLTKLAEENELRRKASQNDFEERTKLLERQHSFSVAEAKQESQQWTEKYMEALELQREMARETQELSCRLEQCTKESQSKQVALEASITTSTKDAAAARRAKDDAVARLAAAIEERETMLQDRRQVTQELSAQLQSQATAHQSEVTRLRAQETSTLEQVKAHVRKTVARKDAMISSLKHQLHEVEKALET